MTTTPNAGLRALSVLAAFVAGMSRVFAVILMGTGDPAANTTAPGGTLDGSGWQWIGGFDGFCGTPIGPSSFLTAAHIGGAVGDRIDFDGRTYRTVGFVTDPASDLRVWHVCGEFARHATPDTEDVAVGDGIVVFGRGTQRGEAVMAQRPGGLRLAGWKWGAPDAVQRWGTNAVASLLDNAASGGRGLLFHAEFNQGKGNDECALSGGDSGGPAFVRRTAGWRLAGINFLVDGPFNTSADGDGFQAAIFDAAGLYVRNDLGQWVQIPGRTIGATAGFYCTRIAPRNTWLQGVLAEAPPPARVEASDAWPPAFVEIVPLAHDPVARTFLCAEGGGSRVFRLRGAAGIRIVAVTRTGDGVRIDYE